MMPAPPPFEPTSAAARARLAAVNPEAYARSRNHLEGAATRLSPYLTHGLLTLREVVQALHARAPLPLAHKLVQELAWRDYFHHVWRHRGDGIFESLHAGPRPEADYAPALPADLLEGRTGVPALDAAVRELHATGHLHNHVRLWLASYTVHVRGVHWRAGADWLYSHLLDGDLTSNHLSWQWVAGTGSTKPYLFNADNVARFAPPAWHSPGSAIDIGYDAMDRLARGACVAPRPPTQARLPWPEDIPPAPVAAVHAVPPNQDDGEAPAFQALEVAQVAGRAVWIVQPWALGAGLNAAAPAGALRIGWLLPPWHARWPWSEARWRFVLQGLAACCDLLWWAPPDQGRAVLQAAASVDGWADPHTQPLLHDLPLRPRQALLPDPGRACDSFSAYWRHATRGLRDLDDLLR